jgi:ABC-type multidrug transport system fused ATPase/permease subunit
MKDMHVDLKKCARAVTAAVLVGIFAVPQSLMAQAAAHVVTPAELQKAAVDASRARQHNLESLRSFFSSDKAQQALNTAHLDAKQVKDAVSTLSDAELATLASRAQKAQADFAAGTLSDRDLIVILVAIAVLILIIVAVR